MQEPRKVVERYAAGDGAGDDDSAGKAFVSLNWLLSEEPLDLETELAWGFLDYLLLGTSAAPLRKALNDSGLGEALIGVPLLHLLLSGLFPILCIPLPRRIPTTCKVEHIVCLVYQVVGLETSYVSLCSAWA